jgi:hypothetical protein
MTELRTRNINATRIGRLLRSRREGRGINIRPSSWPTEQPLETYFNLVGRYEKGAPYVDAPYEMKTCVQSEGKHQCESTLNHRGLRWKDSQYAAS